MRRLEEEFGFSIPLYEFLNLVYRAADPVSHLVEYEYLHVFRGAFPGEPHPNPGEIGDWSWMSIPNVRRSLETSPETFTPWFALLFQRIFSASPGGAAFEFGTGFSNIESQPTP